MRPIAENDLFGKIGRRDKHAIDRFFSVREFPAKDVIFEQGSAPTEVWAMVSGSALLTQSFVDATRTLDRSVSPGEVLGLTETLARIPRIGTLKAITPCVFRTINDAMLMELLKDRPAVRNAMLKTLAENFLESYSRLVQADACDINHIP